MTSATVTEQVTTARVSEAARAAIAKRTAFLRSNLRGGMVGVARMERTRDALIAAVEEWIAWKFPGEDRTYTFSADSGETITARLVEYTVGGERWTPTEMAVHYSMNGQLVVVDVIKVVLDTFQVCDRVVDKDTFRALRVEAGVVQNEISRTVRRLTKATVRTREPVWLMEHRLLEWLTVDCGEWTWKVRCTGNGHWTWRVELRKVKAKVSGVSNLRAVVAGTLEAVDQYGAVVYAKHHTWMTTATVREGSV